MNSLRLAVAAVAAAALLPSAASAASYATPLCQPHIFAGADFSAKTNPTLPGTAVAFDGSCSRANADIGWSSVAPDTWQWNFGDGTTAEGTSQPTHVYATPGTYTVTLTEWAEYSTGTWSASHDVIVLP
jgi:hypothetical protein